MAKTDKKVFKEMLNLCYQEEQYEELHRELLSLSLETKEDKDYETAMQEILNLIPIFAEDFPLDVLSQIEELFQDYLENE